MPALSKGERFQVSARLPASEREHFQKRANEFGTWLGDYVAARVLICEGLDITPEMLRSGPKLIRMYPMDLWVEKIAALPPEVADKVRAELTAEEIEESGVEPPEQLAMTA